MKKCIVLLVVFGFSVAASAQKSSDRIAVLATLSKQAVHWNNAQIEQFMEGYWQSDSLRFIGSEGIAYGYEATLARYKKSYPDKASMGTLRFEVVSLDFMGKEAAFMVGKWFLTRPEKGDLKGHFTLLWKKIKGKWVIVTDHSS
ncbi:MAG: nuclear transport factor 2 family protein [Verrucomicrobia bacterium]|nr:nuclear transport factor 2 family protein [Cytophagales bacterium]